MGVDDVMCDWSYSLFNEILGEACVWCDAVSYDEAEKIISEVDDKTKEEWYNFLWNYDVSSWKPTIDDRSLPGRDYTNKIYDALEYRAYDLKGIVMDYIAFHARESKK